MTEIKKKIIITNLLKLAPLLLLFIAVLNEFDFNYLENFSFNFPFILIFYWSLKKSESLGYGFIFLAGLINDVVTGLPVGTSSLGYLLICGFAAYLRNITLRPSLVKDWFFFLFTILVINSLNYSFLYLYFSIDLNYVALFFNIVFTFLFYLLFAYIFKTYQKAFFTETDD